MAQATRKAIVYRMATPDHLCPFGLKTVDLLAREGFTVEDHRLGSRAETDAFKAANHVDATPQVFIAGKRIGGYDAIRRYLGESGVNSEAITYRPVVAVFATAACMACATSWAAFGSVLTIRAAEWFISFSMCILAILKLRDLEAFTNTFLGYDLLARRIVRYAYAYPFAEAFAGILMIAGVAGWLAGPVAFFIGSVGAVSVIKAVYIDGRELKCACVGGNTNVPLGFISLTENLMMVAMAVWIWVQ